MRIGREDLLRTLESVSPGLSPRDVVEQSSCVVFTDNNVFAYNGEVACRRACNLGISGAVAAAPFITMLSKFPEESVDIVQGQGVITIQGNKRKADIRTEAEILMPIDKIEDPGVWQPLPAGFCEAVDVVQSCASRGDEHGFALTCVHIHPKWLEACDNLQLARYPLAIPIEQPTLVKRDSIKHITGLGVHEVSETTNFLHFRNPTGLVISCRRYLETFVDMENVLAVKGSPMALPGGLADALDRAEVFSREQQDNNRVQLEMKPGGLRIIGEGASGKYTETKTSDYKGPPIRFLISPKILADIGKQHNDCTINEERLKVNGAGYTIVICLEKVAKDTPCKPTHTPAQ